VIRVHFTSADLSRIRIDLLGPLAETQLSLMAAQRSSEAALFSSWRSRVRPLLSVGDLPALVRGLAPAGRHLVDLFTLAGAAPDLDSALDSLLSEPRLLHDQLAAYPHLRRLTLPPWVYAAGAGEGEAARHLAGALKSAYQATVAPHWARMSTVLHNELGAAVQALARGGIDVLLSSLHPAIRWKPPLLEVDYQPWTSGPDLHLAGDGMVITPSVFCRSPLLFGAAGGELMLIYPVVRSVLAAAHLFGDPTQNPGVANLLGRTRAAVLEVTDGDPTTGQVARLLGISPASASQHATVLREAGLVTSRRRGKTVHHTITPLGRALLDGNT
jgi:DNA-binding transcriptional ArsR family regulator